MFRALVMACVLSFPGQALAQPLQNDADLAALAEAARVATGAPAAGVMVWSDGRLRLGVSGVREHRGDVPVTVEDLWHLGSNTKSMTAVLVARLAERGLIRWDDTVHDHLGGRIETIDPVYSGLNFRHLLSHRAGVRPNIGLLDMVRFASEDVDGRPMPEQRLDYVGRILAASPEATPEEDFLYSNAGYVVAAAMLESVTGESWESLMRHEVFEPLGLNTAGFGAPGSVDVVDQPRGHRSGLFGGLTPKSGEQADNPPVMGPAGTVHMSLADTGRYMAAHLAGSRGEDATYLSAESWALLHTPPFGGEYAMGWGLRDGRLLHAGSNTMWLVQFVMDPQENTAIAVAFNDGRVNRLQPQVGDIVEAVLGE